MGILSSEPVEVAAWSSDNICLAYGLNNTTSGGIEVRCYPDFQLAARWTVPSWPVAGLPSWSGLLWTPANQAVLFIFDRGDASSIGLARLGETEWQDLLPGEKARMGVNKWKNLQGWLDKTTLVFTHGCGTGCSELDLLDVVTGEILPIPQIDDYLIASTYLFSPDRRWLAANSVTSGFPVAAAWEWPGPGEAVYFSSHFGTVHSQAEFWNGDSLGVIIYPPGKWQDWTSLPCPTLYMWDAVDGAARPLAQCAYRATVAPTGDRLAIFFFGEPYREGEVVESTGNLPYLGLFDWPSGRLLAAYQIGSEEFPAIKRVPSLPSPDWSPDGQWLAFPLYGGGVSLMERGGSVQTVLQGRDVEWIGWGSNGHLALLVDGNIWLVRVLPLDDK